MATYKIITEIWYQMDLPLCKFLSTMYNYYSNETQRRVQTTVEHLKWSFLRKYLTAESRQLVLQKDPS